MGFECCRRKRLFGFRGDPQQLLSNHRWPYVIQTLVPEGTASLGGCIKATARSVGPEKGDCPTRSKNASRRNPTDEAADAFHI